MNSDHESLRKIIVNRYGPEIANKIRHLEFLRRKTVRLLTSLTFLTKCRDWDLIPTCARIKPRGDIAHSEGILRSASVRLLKQIIRNDRCHLDRVQSDLYKLHLECSAVLTTSDFELCDRVTYSRTQITYERSTAGHDRKFKKLLARREAVQAKVQSGTEVQTVVNMSSATLNTEMKNILEKGLNFALTPKRIPYEDVVSGVEEAIMKNKIPPNDAETLRQDVSIILRKSRVPQPNISLEERKALADLRSNEDILVLKADKGNATVVMDTTDYDNKIRSLLSDEKVYKPVTYNPTARVTKRIRSLIQDHRDLFTDDDFEYLYKPAIVQPPKLYGLPKVHKPGVPLRPIVSQINSPTYKLAKHVSAVLQPLVGQTSSFVKDSRHFIDIIKSTKMEPDDIMVSFDVESLFTNVPVKECLEVVKKKLSDKEFPEQYIVMIQNCLDGNYFLYQGQHYLQIDGVAMGSPVAPVLANIWMEHFESLLDLACYGVKIWKRYVDDVFCILKGGSHEIENFNTYLNSIHPKIQFTHETEKSRTLAFLDVKIMVRTDGSFAHSVYRKPTHTDRYLHATSHHHPRHLQSVVSSLTNRAYDLCDPEHLNKELAHVQEVLKRNGYKGLRRQQPKCTSREKLLDVSRQPTYLPYVKGVTDKIGNVLKKFSVKTIFTPLTKVAKLLRSPKDVTPLQVPGVYKVDCSCGLSYIGQTKRTIAERVKEHIAAVKNRQVNKSAIAEHLLDSGPNHWIELHDPKILANERHYYKRMIREAIEIKKYPNFNREDGFRLPTSWNPVIGMCTKRSSVTFCRNDTVSVVCCGVNAAVPNNEDL